MEPCDPDRFIHVLRLDDKKGSKRFRRLSVWAIGNGHALGVGAHRAELIRHGERADKANLARCLEFFVVRSTDGAHLLEIGGREFGERRRVVVTHAQEFHDGSPLNAIEVNRSAEY